MIRIAAAIVAACSLVCLPVAADRGDRFLRFGMNYVHPAGDGSQSLELAGGLAGSVRFAPRPRSAFGLAVELEQRITGRIGVDLGLRFVDHQVRVDARGTATRTAGAAPPQTGTLILAQPGDVTIKTLSAGIRYHFPVDGPYDPWLGCFVGRAQFEDLHVDPGTAILQLPGGNVALPPPGRRNLDIETDTFVGWTAGLELPIGEGRWALSLLARYETLDAHFDDDDEPVDMTLALDPWSVQLGARLRF